MSTNLPTNGKDIWMIASYSGNAHRETSMNYTTYNKTDTPKYNLLWNRAQKNYHLLTSL